MAGLRTDRSRVGSLQMGISALWILCLLTGHTASAEHLDGAFHGEHERVGMVRKVADRAILNLNDVEKPSDEAFTLGRVMTAESSVNHGYKSIDPRGLLLTVGYEAVKNTTKQTAVCTVEVWETLRGDITITSNSCDFTVKAGVPTASFVDPHTGGFKQDASSEESRSAVAQVKADYFPQATVVYSCSVRTMSDTLHKKPHTVYYVNVASKADCTDAVPAEVWRTPTDTFIVMTPPEIPPEASVVTKVILSIVCVIIWAALWYYHEWNIKKVKAEAVARKAEEEEMKRVEKIKEVLEAEK